MFPSEPVELTLTWESAEGIHTDCFFSGRDEIWTERIPEALAHALSLQECARNDRDPLARTGLVPPHRDSAEVEIGRSEFIRVPSPGLTVEPRFGRFYPKSLVRTVLRDAQAEIFRCTGVAADRLTLDFGHPLTAAMTDPAHFVHLSARPPLSFPPDLRAELLSGPGMQVRHRGRQTDFFSDEPFGRADTGDDSLFYRRPRFVNHIDEVAVAVVTSLHGLLLRRGMKVLDLLSSWRSHLPPTLELDSVTGLGLNSEEMAANTQLTSYLVHDVNTRPQLPFDDHTFDAVICTVSVEYFIRPFEVFQDVARVLRRGGLCVATFSNRWFPTKAISLWPQLHEFERMGLVLEYFLRTERYPLLRTFSLRGLPRPRRDRYYPRVRLSDPVCAVWGQLA